VFEVVTQTSFVEFCCHLLMFAEKRKEASSEKLKRECTSVLVQLASDEKS